jgi:hypothetical protein
MALNRFADWSQEQYAQGMLGLKRSEETRAAIAAVQSGAPAAAGSHKRSKFQCAQTFTPCSLLFRSSPRCMVPLWRGGRCAVACVLVAYTAAGNAFNSKACMTDVSSSAGTPPASSHCPTASTGGAQVLLVPSKIRESAALAGRSALHKSCHLRTGCPLGSM